MRLSKLSIVQQKKSWKKKKDFDSKNQKTKKPKNQKNKKKQICPYIMYSNSILNYTNE
jgi:hypothetical protein